MEKNVCGIVSYAGLNRETLFSLGKAAFVQAQPPVPKRFDAFLPLFPLELVQRMDYLGVPESRSARVAPSGFSIDPAEYHRKLHAQMPDLYEEDNYARNFDYEGRYLGRGVFSVDTAWVNRFPQYQPFLGEKLMIYLLGGGFEAVAVPESVYPRGGGVLETAERVMQVTQRAQLFVQYTRARVAGGDRYDPDAFAADFLNKTGLEATFLTQAELSRVLQDLSIVKSLQSDTVGVGLYTEIARRAEKVLQYTPMRYACDQFDVEAVDKHTARLAQLCFADNDFVSDLWIPYQDLNAYIDRRTMTLDVRSLCEGYQIAPRYDPDTFGGRYPDTVRVAVVRDRQLRLLVGEVLNNPAYGDGMSPQGIIGRQVYIPDSREMIRQRKLALEEMTFATENLTLPPDAYRKALLLAVLQEHKGRLVDAMYRRETALRQMKPDAPVYEKAEELLTERVEKFSELVRRESALSGMSQMSGYDADIDYLRRKCLDREGIPEETVGAKPIAFARDALREQNIESGYAMRAGLLRLRYADAALPDPPAGHILGADDSEEEAVHGSLPQPGASAANTPSTPERDPSASHADFPPTDISAEASRDAEACEPSEGTDGTGASEPPEGADGTGASEPPEETDSTGASEPSEGTDGTDASEPRERTDGTGASEPREGTDGTGASEPREGTDGTDASEPHEGTDGTDASEPRKGTDGTGASEPHEGTDGTGASEPREGTDGTGASEPREGTDGTGASEPREGADEAGAAQATDAAATGEPHRKVSLRELTDQPSPETAPAAEPAPDEPKAPEPEKPKLAYFVRRGSEARASKAYNRMTELLNKRDP